MYDIPLLGYYQLYIENGKIIKRIDISFNKTTFDINVFADDEIIDKYFKKIMYIYELDLYKAFRKGIFTELNHFF